MVEEREVAIHILSCCLLGVKGPLSLGYQPVSCHLFVGRTSTVFDVGVPLSVSKSLPLMYIKSRHSLCEHTAWPQQGRASSLQKERLSCSGFQLIPPTKHFDGVWY